MKEILIVKVKIINEELFLNKIWQQRINVWQIKFQYPWLTCHINNKDLPKLQKLYVVKIVHNYSLKNIFKKLKTNWLTIILFIWGIFLFNILSNVIVKVNIESNNKQLVTLLSKSLTNKGIERLKLKKNYPDLQIIKNELMQEYHNQLEWLEITNIGMTYQIKLEERKLLSKSITSSHCHVVASKDGLITKIIASSGEIMVKEQTFVKEGDLLISGSIYKDNEIKQDICANGQIYGERWYDVMINIPTTYQTKEYTNKVHYNFLLAYDNRDYQILKHKYQHYDTELKEIISLLGKKFYLQKEYEYKIVNKSYNDEDLDNKINELVETKLNLSLNEDEHILTKNILKKEVNDSTISIEVFVTIEELISKQISY
jgi:similar to stage IV sporulation protein